MILSAHYTLYVPVLKHATSSDLAYYHYRRGISCIVEIAYYDNKHLYSNTIIKNGIMYICIHNISDYSIMIGCVKVTNIDLRITTRFRHTKVLLNTIYANKFVLRINNVKYLNFGSNLATDYDL